ncbi:hypothetical protein, partial [Streptomyces sp. NPDC048845]|uniref:hypothetical protein n=1 Tax=Streptomyces sp. NPDC048845 TaxID=3155390 RepID=UPI00342984FD
DEIQARYGEIGIPVLVLIATAPNVIYRVIMEDGTEHTPGRGRVRPARHRQLTEAARQPTEE